MTFKTILVPIDFSEDASAGLDHAVALAKQFDGKIHLLHCYSVYHGAVTPYGIALPESFEQECRATAVAETRKWLDRVRGEGVEAEMTVSPSIPAEAIAALAEEIDADLVVMGSRGLTGLKHLFLGSVAERTLRIAPCPVLTVKRADAA